MEDSFYDYSQFDNNRLKNIMTGWDNFTGNHGLVMKFCAKLLRGVNVLDVGCGLCHLYEALNEYKHTFKLLYEYVGIDNDERVLSWSKERYPSLELLYSNVYNLSILGKRKFDTVFAIGLYRMPFQRNGIEEMLKHTRQQLILTYLHHKTNPRCLPQVFWEILENSKHINSVEILAHNITGIEIVRISKC